MTCCNGNSGLFGNSRQNEWLWVIIIAIILIFFFGCND